MVLTVMKKSECEEFYPKMVLVLKPFNIFECSAPIDINVLVLVLTNVQSS